MKLSARNGLNGTVTDIAKGAVMAKVKIRLGDGQSLTSLISVEAVDDLGLKVGDDVTAARRCRSSPTSDASRRRRRG